MQKSHIVTTAREDRSSRPPGTQAVGRAIGLLKLVGSSRVRNLRLVDIAEMASMDKSTTHRLLQRLVYEGMLRHSPGHGYRLGLLAYELGLLALPEADLRETSRPTLQALAQATGDTVFLVVRSGLESVCLNRITGDFPIQTMTRAVGDRHPLGMGAGGLAILASLSDADVEAIVRATKPRLPAYGFSERMMLDAVNITRQRCGLAVDEGHVARDVGAVGRAVATGEAHPAFAAVFVASIMERMTTARRRQLDKQLLSCTAAIERSQPRPW